MTISRRSRTLVLLGATLSVLSCSSRGPASDQLRMEPIASPAASGSSAPSIAAGADGGLYLSWIERVDQVEETGAHALRFSVWERGAWSAPRTIASGDDWFV
ncbi:MAG: hypothetical protein JSV80_04015, partial [Acidobacteriota bacterium]